MSNYFGTSALDAFYATYRHEVSTRLQQPRVHSTQQQVGSLQAGLSLSNREAQRLAPKVRPTSAALSSRKLRNLQPPAAYARTNRDSSDKSTNKLSSKRQVPRPRTAVTSPGGLRPLGLRQSQQDRQQSHHSTGMINGSSLDSTGRLGSSLGSTIEQSTLISSNHDAAGGASVGLQNSTSLFGSAHIQALGSSIDDVRVLGPDYTMLKRIELSSLRPKEGHRCSDFPFAPRRPELADYDDDSVAVHLSGGGTIDTRADNSSSRLRPVSAPSLRGALSRPGAFGGTEAEDFQSVVGAYLSIATKTPGLDAPPFDNGSPYDTTTLASPRTAYIRGCIDSHQRPKPGLILRRDVTGVLDLRHRGMGDAAAEVFAHSMRDMPYVHTLNICDNNLTDKGLTALIAAVVTMKSLTRLDISQNKIDKQAAAALARCIADPSCCLSELTLCDADVDDDECCSFISAIRHNNRVRDLNLSRNSIGSAENLNTVRPQYTTGAEALGQCIRSSQCSLEKLVVSWNKIRLDGAAYLADSLKFNSSLTYVDLSYNSLGTVAGEVLGGVVMENKSLRTLLLGHNGIDARACFTLCVGLQLNTTLRELGIEGNPIGKDGARALLEVPIAIGSRTKLLSGGCNTTLRDPSFPLNRDAPSGSYSLDLSKPFQRALTIKLLSIVASNTSYTITKCHYDASSKASSTKPRSGSPTGRRSSMRMGLQGSISLIRKRLPLDLAVLDDKKRACVVALRRLVLASENYSEALWLFNTFDSDKSGSIDREEFSTLLADLGVQASRETVEAALAALDVDGTGSIEMDEFLAFLRSQHSDAEARLQELTTFMGMVAESNPTVAYIPPSCGTLSLHIVDDFSREGCNPILHMYDFECLREVLKASSFELAEGFMMVARTALLRIDEARLLMHELASSYPDRISQLNMVLPRMVDVGHARQLVAEVIGSDKYMLHQLFQVMGNALRPILGYYSGYYELDLSRENDRTCLALLLGLSKDVGETRQHRYENIFGLGKVGDCSQKGNWTAFRNEIMNGVPTAITPSLFVPFPHRGTISFDFCATLRPLNRAVPLHETRFINLLRSIGFVNDKNEEASVAQLRGWDKYAAATIGGSGAAQPIASIERAREIQTCSNAFYTAILERSNQHFAARLSEDLANISTKESGIITTNLSTANDAESSTLGVKDISLSPVATKRKGHSKKHNFDTSEDGFGDSLETIEYSPDGAPLLNAYFITSTSYTACKSNHSLKSLRRLSSAGSEQTSADAKRRASKSSKRDESSGVSPEYVDLYDLSLPPPVRANRFVQSLISIFRNVWMTSRQLASLLALFPLGRLRRTQLFGTYRVELFVELFSRIVDPVNLDIAIRVLTAFEAACVYCRIGWLHLFNPMKPEGCFMLDLSRPEERLVTKQLILLSKEEPGENIRKAYFRWRFEDPDIQSWVLVQTWLTDEGLPRRGVVTLEYYSGEGLGVKGCIANVNLRLSLLALVYCSETDIEATKASLSRSADARKAKAHLHHHSSSSSSRTTMIGDGTGRGTDAVGAGEAATSSKKTPSNRRPSRTVLDGGSSGNGSSQRLAYSVPCTNGGESTGAESTNVPAVIAPDTPAGSGLDAATRRRLSVQQQGAGSNEGDAQQQHLPMNHYRQRHPGGAMRHGGNVGASLIGQGVSDEVLLSMHPALLPHDRDAEDVLAFRGSKYASMHLDAWNNLLFTKKLIGGN